MLSTESSDAVPPTAASDAPLWILEVSLTALMAGFGNELILK